jgi:hypothetical protein
MKTYYILAADLAAAIASINIVPLPLVDGSYALPPSALPWVDEARRDDVAACPQREVAPEEFPAPEEEP